jgi:hypothetical protein
MEISDIMKAIQGADKSASCDVVASARAISRSVGVFLADKGIVAGVESMNGVHAVSGSFDGQSAISLGREGLMALITEAKVPAQYQEAALEELCIIVGRAAIAHGNTASMVAAHLDRAQLTDTARQSVIGIAQLMPETLQGYYHKSHSGMEHFGIDTDKLSSDITTAMTVSLMKWHNSIAARLLPTIAATNPLVVYKRDEFLVFDLADSETELTPVLDLYRQPSKVANELQKIIPLRAGVILSEGVIPMNTPVNLFAVSKDATKYGTGTVNRTDLVADDVKLSSVLVKAAWTVGENPFTATLKIAIPLSRAGLHRVPRTKSTFRSAAITHAFQAGEAFKNEAGAAIGAVGGLWTTHMTAASGDKIAITLNITPSIDIRTSDFSVYGQVSVKAVAADGGTPSANTIENVTFSLVGVEIDARYSEENFRKSSIISTQETSELLYEVPPGRTFGADRSHREAQDVAAKDKQVANLMRIATIGLDDVAIRAIESYIDTVNDETALFNADSINNPRPGMLYAAGGKVYPTVVIDTLDVSKVSSFDDARRRAALGHRVESFLGGVVCEMMTKSLMRQQLAPDSKLVLRCLTTPTILTNVIAAGTKSVGTGDGVEYAMELPDGTILEFVTTTFESFGDKILMMPYIKGDPNSDLNFGHNRSCGTQVCAFTASYDTASALRLMASVRELPIPTNVVGASIAVTGVEVANFRSAGE